MKRLLLTAAALALLTTTTARALDTAEIATATAMIMAYDHKCEKLPPDAKAKAKADKALAAISPAAFKAGTEKVLEWYRGLGPTEFCATMKPMVNNALTGASK